MNNKAVRAGRLAEDFVRRVFGVGEPTVEIKATGQRRKQVVLCAWQLLGNLDCNKQYVIVRYTRASKTISRGPRKGRPVFTETIEAAFKHPLDVYVTRASRLVDIVVQNKLQLWCSGKNREVMQYGKFGLLYRIEIRDVYAVELEKTDQYTLYGDPLDPPAWKPPNLRQDDFLPFDGSGVGQPRTVPKDDVPF